MGPAEAMDQGIPGIFVLNKKWIWFEKIWGVEVDVEKKISKSCPLSWVWIRYVQSAGFAWWFVWFLSRPKWLWGLSWRIPNLLKAALRLLPWPGPHRVGGEDGAGGPRPRAEDSHGDWVLLLLQIHIMLPSQLGTYLETARKLYRSTGSVCTIIS